MSMSQIGSPTAGPTPQGANLKLTVYSPLLVAGLQQRNQHQEDQH
jgi:hypothetical protein